MRETRITIPELVLIGATRGLAGAGLGLLLANRLSDDQRRAVGWSLFLIGALSTIPLAFEVFGGRRLSASAESGEQTLSGSRTESDDRLGLRGVLGRRLHGDFSR